jgi:hypothetical protein
LSRAEHEWRIREALERWLPQPAPVEEPLPRRQPLTLSRAVQIAVVFAFGMVLLDPYFQAPGAVTGVNVAAPRVTSSSITCTIKTADASRTAVAAAVAAANSGDTICVAAGSDTWSSSITVTNSNKALTIAGSASWAGTGTTSITCSARCFYWSSNTTNDVAIRITGFTLSSSDSTFYVDSDGGGFGPQGWRIDHIIRTNSSGGIINFFDGFGGPSLNSGLEGLIDNNTIYNGRIVFYGEAGTPYGTGGHYRWIEPTNFGAQNFVYVEDNLFDNSSVNPNVVNGTNTVDGNNGAKYIYRFNDFNNGRVEAHGVQGTHRATRAHIFMYNSFIAPSNTDCILRYFFLRGGESMVFGNRTDGDDGGGSSGCPGTEISIDVARSNQQDTDPTFASQIVGVGGGCDGDAWVDENQSGQEGWACLDQAGAGVDSTMHVMTGSQGSTWAWSTTARNTYVTQARSPWYLWDNIRTDTNNDIDWDHNCVGFAASCTRQETKLIVRNRDIYTSAGNTAQVSSSSPFNGTTGTGYGTLANRPSTCTSGVGYWATDQGTWNHSTTNARGVPRNGADGQLFKCTATNTWTLHFEPYTYPHPLRGGV